MMTFISAIMHTYVFAFRLLHSSSFLNVKCVYLFLDVACNEINKSRIQPCLYQDKLVAYERDVGA